MSILVTGGAGYIGSHTAVELLDAGENIIILDNFSNSSPEVLDKIKQITKKDFKFYKVDLLDENALDKVFEDAHKTPSFRYCFSFYCSKYFYKTLVNIIQSFKCFMPISNCTT